MRVSKRLSANETLLLATAQVYDFAESTVRMQVPGPPILLSAYFTYFSERLRRAGRRKSCVEHESEELELLTRLQVSAVDAVEAAEGGRHEVSTKGRSDPSISGLADRGRPEKEGPRDSTARRPARVVADIEVGNGTLRRLMLRNVSSATELLEETGASALFRFLASTFFVRCSPRISVSWARNRRLGAKWGGFLHVGVKTVQSEGLSKRRILVVTELCAASSRNPQLPFLLEDTAQWLASLPISRVVVSFREGEVTHTRRDR